MGTGAIAATGIINRTHLTICLSNGYRDNKKPENIRAVGILVSVLVGIKTRPSGNGFIIALK